MSLFKDLFGIPAKTFKPPTKYHTQGWDLAQTLATQQKVNDQQKVRIMAKKNSMETGCQCESCDLLKTAVGNAMLKWGGGMINAAAEAVRDGADPDAELTMDLQGPDASQLKTMHVGQGHKSYATLTMKLGEFGKDVTTSRLVGPAPDWHVLREEYEDDPVILELIGWMERRLHGNVKA